MPKLICRKCGSFVRSRCKSSRKTVASCVNCTILFPDGAVDEIIKRFL